MRVDLHDTQIRIASGMSSDGPKCASMFSCQSDHEASGTDGGGDKRLNGIYCLTIDFAVENERASSGNAAPLSIGLAPKRFVV
jgi:hypothetical protein